MPAILVGMLEDAEILQPSHVLERAWDEVGYLLRGELGH
jgi:hypothetical protein